MRAQGSAISVDIIRRRINVHRLAPLIAADACVQFFFSQAAMTHTTMVAAAVLAPKELRSVIVYDRLLLMGE